MICAALCWRDEPPELLNRCIASLEGIADALVALDGAWTGFDHPRAFDEAEQWSTIHAAAERAGITASVGGIGIEWHSQIEKRDALMRTACQWGDWVLVVDADDFIDHAASDLHDLLDETTCDVAEIHARYWIGRRETSRTVRRLFRSAVGISVVGAHNGYRSDDGRWLHAPSNIETVPALDLTGELRLTHDASPRSRSRQRAMARYYAFRAANNEESSLRKQEPACAT